MWSLVEKQYFARGHRVDPLLLKEFFGFIFLCAFQILKIQTGTVTRSERATLC